MENIKLKNIRNHLLVGTLSMVLLSSCMPTVIERDRDNCAAVSQNMNARKMVSDLTIKSNIKKSEIKKILPDTIEAEKELYPILSKIGIPLNKPIKWFIINLY